MKFAIHLSDLKGKRLWRASGFPGLNEVCAAAVAVAGCHAGKELFVNIETAGKVYYGCRHHFGGICCESIENFPLKYVRERADVEMGRLKVKRRESKARERFIKQHGGYAGELITLIFPQQPAHGIVLGDEVLRECYFKNDFDGVLRRFEEIKKVQVVA